MQQERDDQEANELRDKQRGVETKLLAGALCHVDKSTALGRKYHVFNHTDSKSKVQGSPCTFLELFNEKDCEKHDAFSEGRAQDRLDENLRGRAWIASNRFGSSHTNHTHADRSASGGCSDVNITR
jgi:hypothetical protein